MGGGGIGGGGGEGHVGMLPSAVDPPHDVKLDIISFENPCSNSMRVG
jgi:hypothetical protein